MILRLLDVIGTVWTYVALGTLLMLVGTGAGWAMGRQSSLPPVRWIAWWVRRVVLPLIRCRAWWRRAAMIFVNNASILALLLALGRWRVLPLFGIAAMGMSLGIAIRVMLDLPADPLVLGPARSNAERRRMRVGVALNLLEPPVIMLTIGLSLAQQAIPLSSAQVWETFALWVIPATLLAAGGEALWLGTGRDAHTAQESLTPEDTDSHHDP